MDGAPIWNIDAVGNDREFISGYSLGRIKINNTIRIGYDSVGSFGQVSVDGKFVPTFPRIDASFSCYDVFDSCPQCGVPTITICSKNPGVNEIGLDLLN